MDFGPSNEQRDLIEKAGAFAGSLIEAFGENPSMTRDLWRFWGDEGWLGLCLPEAHGGAGQEALTAVLAFEAMGRAGVSRSQLFGVGAHLFGCAMTLARYGSASQKTQWLPALAEGATVGALAFSEPTGGSDLAHCETRLRPDGDGYRLDGEKTLVTNGGEADLFLVLARSPSLAPPLDVSAVLLRRDTPGLDIRPIESVSGLSRTRPAEITMEGSRVEQDALLGKAGGGIGVLLGAMHAERACILAGSLGALDRDLEAVRVHVAARGAAEHQAVRHALAKVRARSESARWLLYRGAWGLDHGDRSLLRASISKVTVCEVLVEGAVALAELAAGEGWKGSLGLAEALADATATCTASGTANIQLNTISALQERG